MAQLKAELLADLTQGTKKLLEEAIALQSLPAERLKAKSNPSAWNALECLEHLCRYGDFYLPEINKRLKAATKKNATTFRTGILGNYFSKSVLPGARDMNSLKPMNPIDGNVRKDVHAVFISQQNEILKILAQCEAYDVTQIKTSISISNLIKLRLGDKLQVVIYHNQRHMLQAQKACIKLL